jgi:hypothetical protein
MSPERQLAVKPAAAGPVLRPAFGVLQRQCACGGYGGPEGECEECKQKEMSLQRRASGGGPPPTIVPPIVHEVLRSPGRPLDRAARSLMEARFGHDFGNVRVHADARAAEGHDRIQLPLQRRLAIGAVGDPLELEAEAVADRVMRTPSSPGLGPLNGGGLQRTWEKSQAVDRRLVRKALRGPAPVAAPAIVDEVLREGGRPLDPAVRDFAEPSMGFDFSDVRVHTSERAAQSADAVQALAYTVGNHVVFARGQYAPANPEGRRLLVHELSHTAQQGAATLRRQPAPAGTDSPDSLVLAPAEDKTEKNARIAAFADTARKRLAEFALNRVVVLGFWTSAFAAASSQFGDETMEPRRRARAAANSRGEAVKAVLVKLGIAANSISVITPDLNQAPAPPGTDGQVSLVVLGDLPKVSMPRVPPSALPPPPPGSPLLDLGPFDDLTSSNIKIGEVAKYNLIGPLKDPGGTVTVTGYVWQDPGNDPAVWKLQRDWAQSRADTVRTALISLGVAAADITSDAKLVPSGDNRGSHVTISFTPEATAPAAETSLADLTTIQISNPNFSLTIKIPKSIEFKHRFVEAKATIPKGASVTFKPVRGLPGVQIGISGEITKLSNLFNQPAPVTTPSGVTQPAPGPPLKFSLTAGFNSKGFKIEASTELDLEKRTETTGLFLTLIESNVKYQVPSSVFDDINKAGAQIQKAVNNLVGVADQQVAQAPVGAPPPPPPAAPGPVTASSALSNLADIADGISSILDAMDKIDKAKTAPAQFKLKIGPQLIVPFGPERAPTATDPLGNRPVVSFGITGTF